MCFNKKLVSCASADCCNNIHSEVIGDISILQFKMFVKLEFTLLSYMKVELVHLFSPHNE